jgi:hypothetical protein
MKRYSVLLILFLLTEGCAIIDREVCFLPEAGSGGWRKVDSTFEFNWKTTSFELYSFYRIDHVVAIGPPLLPLFPLFTKPAWDSLHNHSGIKVVYGSEVVRMDLLQVKAHFPSGTNYSAAFFAEGEAYPMKDHNVLIDKEGKTLYFSFDAPYDQSQSFTVEFGKVFVGDSMVTLPSVKYNRRVQYKYLPLVFSH